MRIQRVQVLAVLSLAGGLLAAAGCSGKSESTSPTTITVIDSTRTLQAGVNCANGGRSLEFPGTAGTTVTIVATGSSAPHVTLYAPDFATQLGSSTDVAGRATLTYTLPQSGTYFISFCDANAVGGAVRVVVTRPAA